MGAELAEARRVAAGLPGALAELAGARAEAEREAAVASGERERAVAAAAGAGGALASAERAVRRGAEDALQGLLARRARAEAELAEAGETREEALASLVRLRGARERLAVWRDHVGELGRVLAAELAEARAFAALPGPSPDQLERAADAAAAAARTAAQERDSLAAAAAAAREQLAALDRSLASGDGLSPAARALAAEGATPALALLEVEPGQERAVAAALDAHASSLVASDAAEALELARRAAAGGLGSLRVLVGRDPAELVRRVPVVPLEQLLASDAAAVTPEGFGWDPVRGELWFAGAAAEAVLLELEARRRTLAAEAEELAPRAAAAEREAERAAERAAAAELAYAEAAPRQRRRVPLATLEGIAAAASRLDGALDAAAAATDRPEQALTARAEAVVGRIAALAGELREVGGREGEERRVAAAAAEREAAVERELRRLGTEPGGDGDAALWPELLAEAQGAARAAAEAAQRADAAATAHADALPRRGGADLVRLVRVSALAEGIAAALAAAGAAAERFEQPLRAGVELGASRAQELAAALRELGSVEAEAAARARRARGARVGGAGRPRAARRRGRRRAAAPGGGSRRARARATTEELRRGSSGSSASREHRSSRGSTRSRRRSTPPRRSASRAARPARGPRAVAWTSSSTLRDDLTQRRSSRASRETFAAVERHFAEIGGDPLPGRRGPAPPDRARGRGASEPGIEVELRPAGKRVTRLSLLSGGEKALGAISFLFALFLARPCPSTCSTRSRPRSTTRTSAASSSCCAATPTRRSSSSSRTRSARWRRPTSSTASRWAATASRRSSRAGSRARSAPRPPEPRSARRLAFDACASWGELLGDARRRARAGRGARGLLLAAARLARRSRRALGAQLAGGGVRPRRRRGVGAARGGADRRRRRRAARPPSSSGGSRRAASSPT